MLHAVQLLGQYVCFATFFPYSVGLEYIIFSNALQNHTLALGAEVVVGGQFAVRQIPRPGDCIIEKSEASRPSSVKRNRCKEKGASRKNDERKEM